MWRKAPIVAFVLLSLVACVTWLSRSILVGKLSPHLGGHDEYGSTYTFKGSLAEDKIVVIAKIKSENTTWVEELVDWQHAIYHMDDPTSILHPPVNRGREAMAYLTFVSLQHPTSVFKSQF
jgi:hypothetical protein